MNLAFAVAMFLSGTLFGMTVIALGILKAVVVWVLGIGLAGALAFVFAQIFGDDLA